MAQRKSTNAFVFAHLAGLQSPSKDSFKTSSNGHRIADGTRLGLECLVEIRRTSGTQSHRVPVVVPIRLCLTLDRWMIWCRMSMSTCLLPPRNGKHTRMYVMYCSADNLRYASRGIPLRRGYLFWGPPGTGKSSLSFSLAGLFGCKHNRPVQRQLLTSE